MQRLVYTNALGDKAEFVYSGKGPYALLDFQGIGEISARISTESSPNQDGDYITAKTLDTREVSFKVLVLGQCMEEIYQRRRYLSRLFNPGLGEGVLEYYSDYFSGGKKLRCISTAAPSYPFGKANQTPQYHMALVELLAAENPYFEDHYPTVATLEQVSPLFSFELELLEQSPFEVGTLASGEVLIENSGDAKAPLKIVIYGPVTDPRLTLVETGEYLELLLPLAASERMVITTGFGNKRADIYRENGTVEDGFKYLTLESVFFELLLGKNTLLFTASAGSETAILDISYTKRYSAL